jgi:hypothetical protein
MTARAKSQSSLDGIPAPIAALLDKAPRRVKRTYRLWADAIAALDSAPRGRKARAARVWSRRLAVLPSTVWTKRAEYRKNGPMAIVDKRFSASCWRGQCRGLPALAIQHLKKLGQDDSLTLRDVIHAFAGQLKRWREGDGSARIPGYSAPPPGNPPRGWSQRNLAHYLAPHPRKRSERVVFQLLLQFRANGTATWRKIKASR